MDQLSPRMFVAEMRPDWLFSHLSNHNTHKPVEDARVNEELFQLVERVTSVRVNVLEQLKGEVLLHRNVRFLLCYDVFLNIVVCEISGYLGVFNVAVTGKRESLEVISEPDAFLAGHETVSSSLRHVLLLQQAKTAASEHPSPVIFGEDGVSADFAHCVIAKSFALVVDEYVNIVLEVLLNNCGLLLFNRKVQVFREVSEVVAASVVGHYNFIALCHVGDASGELLKKALF